MTKRVKTSEGQIDRVLFPVPTDLVEEILKHAKCGKCNFEYGDYTNRRCRGCNKLVCDECEVYWSKCTGKITDCVEDIMWGPNSYRMVHTDCIYMSGYKWCYSCMKQNRNDQLVCPKCKKAPTFLLPPL